MENKQGSENRTILIKNMDQVEKLNEIHRIITENTTELFSLVDRKGNIHYISPSIQTVLGYEPVKLEKGNFFEKIHPDDVDVVQEEMNIYCGRTIKKPLQIEFRLLHQNGSYVDVEANINSIKEQSIIQDELLVLAMRDIRERKETEKAIYHLAFHDSLTDLSNRRSFINHLRNEIINSKSTGLKLAVLYIDLDNFKSINDQWGHNIGDLVLMEAANVLKSTIRSGDVAARLGGDEFAVMLKDLHDNNDAIKIVERILEQFQKPLIVDNQKYSLTCSIGIVHYPEHGDSAENLIKNADTALYYIKERSKNNYKVYHQNMENQSLERSLLESAMRKAIQDEEFYLVYQPKINIASKEVFGMEALVRWKHPDLGVIPPGKFISLAEETGLIVPLGEWILRESCRQTVAWQKQAYPISNVSVNISVRQLEDEHFIEKVKEILEETDMNPKYLEFEVTESVLANVKNTVPILKEIQGLGIQISVDDFGTGYSSLSYIKNLPVNTLKVDQSFVKDIHENMESKAIAKAIIQLANSIGLNVIAEGIELPEHEEVLSKDGYELGQGYFYSKPLNVEDFEEFIKKSL